jgi:hypothetical protein
MTTMLDDKAVSVPKHHALKAYKVLKKKLHYSSPQHQMNESGHIERIASAN